MVDSIKTLEKKVMDGEEITFDDAVYLSKLEKSEDIEVLCQSASRIRDHFCGNSVDMCSIMNAKSGKCSEDCKFCAQSGHYKTNVKEYGLVSKEEAMSLAKENEKAGVNRFSLVTSGRGLNEDEVQKVTDIYKRLKKETKLNLCASLGILNFGQLKKLKESGITMYHHNLETSKDYYNNICTTHTYQQRLDTIDAAKNVGLAVCSGGIIGLGESFEDRIKLAFELKSLGVKSIPVNVLNPIKGTPLENEKALSQNDILKSFAIIRFINPKALIRLAGGRNMIDKQGENCFNAGANATITGNYLTTTGNKIVDDMKMVKELKMTVRTTVRTEF